MCSSLRKSLFLLWVLSYGIAHASCPEDTRHDTSVEEMVQRHAHVIAEIKGTHKNTDDPISDDKRPPYSQTTGYLKAFMGDDFIPIDPHNLEKGLKDNLVKFYEDWRRKDYLGITNDYNDPKTLPILEALLEEYKSPEKDFAYHGCHPMIGLLYDIYSEFHRQIMMIQEEKILTFRGVHQAFRGLRTISDFIHEQTTKQNITSFQRLDNYRADYAEKALSVNIFLFGNDASAFDNTIQFFAEGTSDRNILLHRSLQKLCAYFGIDGSNEELFSVTEAFDSLPLLKRGRLFQLIFDKGSIDRYVYLSASLGRGISLSRKPDFDDKEKHVATLIGNIKEDPLAVKDFLEQKRYGERGRSVDSIDLGSLQGRFLPHPDLFSPHSPLRVKSYWYGLPSQSPEISRYKQEVQNFVSTLVTKRLMSQTRLPRDTILTSHSSGILPIQRIYKYVTSHQEGGFDDQGETLHNISEPFLSAYVCAGDLEQLRKIQSEARNTPWDLNQKIIDINDLETETKRSPLYLAVKYNHPKLVKFLLQNNVDIENENVDDRGLMGWACIHEYPEIVGLLLKSGVSPTLKFRERLQKEPYVSLAIDYGQGEILRLFLNHAGFEIDRYDSERLYHYIVDQKNCELLKLFVKKGFLSKLKPTMCPLSRSIKTGSSEFVEILLQSGVPLKKRFCYDTPALFQAIQREDLPLIKMLVQYGANVRKKYYYKGTPLEYAQKTGNLEIIEYMSVL